MSRCAIALGTLACGLVLLGSATAAGTAAASCKTSGLVVWINTEGGGAAAGSVYYKLEFTNQSGHTCALTGYPGVSGVDLRGRQLGSPASRSPSAKRTVNLANGATASAVLQIVFAGNFPPSTCRQVPGAGLRVYPPNETASKLVPIPLNACSRTGPVYLHVKAVAGTGRP